MLFSVMPCYRGKREMAPKSDYMEFVFKKRKEIPGWNKKSIEVSLSK